MIDPLKFISKTWPFLELKLEQKQIVELIKNNNRIAIKSGHGIGKTAILSIIVIWYLCTHADAKVPMTAPTQHQLYDILMPEINKWLNKAASAVKNAFTWTKTRIYQNDNEETWFAVARSCNKAENMQGFHGDNIMFIVDEASGVPNEIMEVIEGALTTKGAKLIMVGNPTKLSGTFFNAFNRERVIYATATFSSEKSKLVSKNFIQRMLKYGRDSDVFKVRVLGQFPGGEPDTLIRLEKTENAINKDIKFNDNNWNSCHIGIDPARFGNDESVICWRKNDLIMPLLGFYGIDTQRLSAECMRLVKEIRQQEFKGIINIKIDDTGIGGGVTDSLKLQEQNKENKIKVIPIVNNAKATNYDYDNLGAQIWGEMRDKLEYISLPGDDELIAQLTTRKYQVQKDGRIILERKEDMKKRGLPSPDRADALGLCLYEYTFTEFEELNKIDKTPPIMHGIRNKMF